jgi:ribosomal protein S18 acetylase RimI-like enzyme
VTTKANQAANGLYQSMGFEVVSAYHYRIHPEDA